MVIKALYYIVGTFFLVALFLMIQEPYFETFGTPSLDVAQIKMNGVEDYEMNYKEVVRHSNAQNIVRYKDKDTLKNPKMLYKKDDIVYSLQGQNGVIVGDLVDILDDVVLTSSDGLDLKTQKITYDIKKKIVFSHSLFELKNKALRANGDSFVYDLNLKQIQATKIKADYKLEKK